MSTEAMEPPKEDQSQDTTDMEMMGMEGDGDDDYKDERTPEQKAADEADSEKRMKTMMR